MQLTGLDRLLWALALGEHCLLLAVLFIRHRARTFPIFTALIGANILKTVGLYLTLRLAPHAYFNTYWTLVIVDVALQLAVAYELASLVFKPLGAWDREVRRSFLGIIALSLLLAAGLTWLASPPMRSWQQRVVIRGNFFASVLMSECFVAMVVLSVTLGLAWRTHVARIAQGFGIFSLFGIFSDAAHNLLGAHYYQMVSHLEIELYLAVVAYWIVTLTIKEPAPRRLPEELRLELRSLQSKLALVLASLRAMGSTS